MYATRAQIPADALGHHESSDIEALATLCEAFAVERDLTSTLNAALESMVRDLSAQAAEAFLWQEEGVFRFASSRGRGTQSWRADNSSDPLLAQCLTEDTIIIGPGGDLAPGAAYVPLRASGRPYGVIRVRRKVPSAPFGEHDRALLRAMAGVISMAISNARLKVAVEGHQDTARDLEYAAEIQRNLLPNVEPGAQPVFGLNRPIRQVSGDFFDFFALPDRRIAFALGDVSGKGMNAALLMAKAASLFRCLGKSIFDPAQILRRLNDEIVETISRGMFVTMVAGIYDPARGRVVFANAGHEPPLLRTRDHRYESFAAAGPPLGILPDLPVSAREINLDGGEFFIFSDGLTEFRYEQGEYLGVDGLIQMIESLSALPLAERMHKLLNELTQEGWHLRDDLTVLAIDDAWVKPHE